MKYKFERAVVIMAMLKPELKRTVVIMAMLKLEFKITIVIREFERVYKSGRKALKALNDVLLLMSESDKVVIITHSLSQINCYIVGSVYF